MSIEVLTYSYGYFMPSHTTLLSTLLSSIEQGYSGSTILRSPGTNTTSLTFYSSAPQEMSLQRSWEGLDLIVRNTVANIVGRDVVRNIMIYNDLNYGLSIRLIVDLNAKEALELWLRLVEKFPYSRYGIVLGVRWTGENNVSEDELINYVVKIMITSGIEPIAKRALDVVEELREERGRR
jgi:hypothetical protein